jgi:uncharacterized protein YcaQ
MGAAPPRVPLRAVAALFLARQGLDRPRGRRLTAASLRRLAESTGGLQLDSINVLDRAHYLTAWSRFGVYDRAALDRLVYRRRVLIEYWAHAACLVPASHLGWWRRAMLDYRLGHTGWSGLLRKNARVIAEVQQAIAERGPLGNADFRRGRGRRGSGWWSWRPAAFALHYLWMTGRLLVHSRTHFHKRFDLAERVYPAIAGLEPPGAEDFARQHICRALFAMGAATEADLAMYLTFPRIAARSRRAVLDRLLAAGRVVELRVDADSTRWFALAEDLPALEAAARRRAPSRGTTLLSPFDSFLWHRRRTRTLFGFDYRIEVYTPGPRRVHGYYALPILHDGQLIGRLDAKNHRAARRLHVRRVHFEPWFADGGRPPAAAWGAVDRDAALAGLGEALGSLAAFVGARRITLGRVAPAPLKAPLRAVTPRTRPLTAGPRRAPGSPRRQAGSASRPD